MSEYFHMRHYRPSDEPGVVYLWLKAFAQTPYGRSIGASRRATADELAFWERHRRVVMRLIARPEAEVRMIYDPDEPSIFWAFACVEPFVVHMAVVKKDYRPWRRPMLEALLGDMLPSHCRLTHQSSDIVSLGRDWTYDPYLLAQVMT